MFWLKVNLILCLGLTFAFSDFPSTSGKPSSIQTSTKAVKHFFQKIDKLDNRVNTPSELKKFGTIKYRNGFRSIRCIIKFLTEFRTEYKKLVTISENVVTDFINEIDRLRKNGRGLLGKEKKRDKLCNYYTDTLLPDIILEGDGAADDKIIELQTKLRNDLEKLYNKICRDTSGQMEARVYKTRHFVGSTHLSGTGGTGGSFLGGLFVGMNL